MVGIVFSAEVKVSEGILSFGPRLLNDHKLCSAVLGVFLGSVFGALQRRAREELGVVGGRSVLLTFVQ